jgi:hypothetical protein
MEFPVVDWVVDDAAGAWIEASVRSFGVDVASVLPPVFDAYARLRHTGDRTGVLVRGEVDALAAALAGHAANDGRCWFAVWEGYGWTRPDASFAVMVAGDEPGFDRDTAERDYRDRAHAFTATLPTPSMLLPHRNYLLYRGPLPAAGALLGWPAHQSPNLWWPEDRSWCVATEIDLDATYVGGSAALIADVCADPRLAATRVLVTEPLS